jgi:hypothetical protein
MPSTLPQLSSIHHLNNRTSASGIRKWAFTLLLLYPQAGVLAFGANYLVFAFGIALFFVGIFQIRGIPRHFAKYGVLFFVLFLLHLLLLFLGKSGEIPARPLFVTGFATFALILTAGILTRSADGQSWIFRSIFVCLVFEIFIVFLQYSYMTYGVGLTPRGEDSLDIGLITGSYGNPNNVAVMIALQVFILHKVGKLENYPLSSWILLFGALLAIFLTLSRTCFFLYVVFIVVYTFSRKKSGEKSPVIFKFLSFFVVALLAFAAFIYFQDLAADGDSVVLDRSIARLSELAETGGDETISFRQISHARLVQNLFNLGIGTFSDLNYGPFFQSYDPELMKVNPHSFLVEMSFLYGYFGFVLAVGFILLLIYDLTRTGLGYVHIVFFSVVVAFFQMIPSSVLSMPAFFLLFVLLVERVTKKII